MNDEVKSMTILGCTAIICATIVLLQFSSCEMKRREMEAMKQGVHVEKQK